MPQIPDPLYFHVMPDAEITYNIADVLKPSPVQRSFFAQSHYLCLPLTAANTLGWTLYNPFEFSVIWKGQNDSESLVIETEHREWVSSWFGYGTFTVVPRFLVQTSPGVDLLIRPVPNHFKFPVMPFDGIVETDWLESGFTLNFRMALPMIKAHFAVGEPLVQFVPYPRQFIEEFETKVITRGERYEKRMEAYKVFKDRRNRQLKDKDKPSLDYMRGVSLDGSPFGDHKKTFHLGEFTTDTTDTTDTEESTGASEPTNPSQSET